MQGELSQILLRGLGCRWRRGKGLAHFLAKSAFTAQHVKAYYLKESVNLTT